MSSETRDEDIYEKVCKVAGHNYNFTKVSTGRGTTAYGAVCVLCGNKIEI